MDIQYKNHVLRIGWKSFSIYRLDAQGNTVPYVGMGTDTGQLYAGALDQAYLNRVVAAAVGWVSEQIASTPVVLERTDARGNHALVDDHDFLEAINMVDDDMSWRELLTVSVWDICTDRKGMAFWYKLRDNRSRVSGLAYLPARQVEVKTRKVRTNDGGQRLITEYRFSPGGTPPVDYRPEDIVRLRLAPDPLDPKLGLPPLRSVASEIWVDGESSRFTAYLLRNRGIPGLIGSPPPEVGVIAKEVADETAEHLDGKLTGSGRGRATILRSAMRLDQLGFNPEEMDLSALHNVTEESVCANLGISPLVIALGAGNEQSRVGAATREIFLHAWLNGVIPKQGAIIEQINRQLLPDFEPDGDYALRFEYSGILALQEDENRRADRLRAHLQGWGITQNEFREELGFERVPGGDVFFIPFNIISMPAGRGPTPATPGLASRRNGRLALKADVQPYQDVILEAHRRDRAVLEPLFADELVRGYEVIGKAAETAFLLMSPELDLGLASRNGNGRNGNGNAPTATLEKQATDLTTEERVQLEAISSRVVAEMMLEMFEEEIWAPAWTAHYLRTIETTVATVNATLSVTVALPGQTQANILAAGGRRRGLIDLTAEMRRSVFHALAEGRAAGEGPPALARRIKDQVGVGQFTGIENAHPGTGARYRAEFIAREETRYAQQHSQLSAYRQSGIVDSMLLLDNQTDFNDEECSARHLTVVTFDEYEADIEEEHLRGTLEGAPNIRGQSEAST